MRVKPWIYSCVKQSLTAFSILCFTCQVFNVYKCFQLKVSSGAFRYLSDDWKSSSNFASNSSVEKTWNEEHTVISLKDRLLLLGKPRNTTFIDNQKTVYIEGKLRKLPIWQHFLRYKKFEPQEDEFGETTEDYYFLVVVLQVRLYAYDKAKWSINELKQWFHYLLLAGVEHILICDHYASKDEMFKNHIKKYIDYQLVTYVEWSGVRNPMASQTKCYQRFIRRFKKYHLWHMAIDIDEYPFSPTDGQENFLVRYLQNVSEEISELSMDNYLMLGRGKRSENLVIKRITRMTKKPANYLSKPIYRPASVLSAAVHHNHLKHGLSRNAGNTLKMLHYWGGRDQHWGPDTAKTLNITEEMHLMSKFWASKLENSLLTFDEKSALSNSTGP
ncbi:hypothetical protein HELRODRAFT_158313 [Helobdella robusta]|uniref:Glycosyltransferase family 92 protein n=1 Tax=Helobdella robusta TaxID=6412 RepID=T1EMM7_HELRO|nr:hypothetical protein HELRODRAFT_158313 [Helobdella robusta]ESO11949.1 hypothetical protein HELRODRAFT_158313 [Helobdella robusta]